MEAVGGEERPKTSAGINGAWRVARVGDECKEQLERFAGLGCTVRGWWCDSPRQRVLKLWGGDLGGGWREPSAGLASECLGASRHEGVKGRQVGAPSLGDSHQISDSVAMESFSRGGSGGLADWLRLRSGQLGGGNEEIDTSKKM